MTVWTLLPTAVTRKVQIQLAGAPTLDHDQMTVAPFRVCVYVINGEPTRVLVEGNMTRGQGSRSGGTVVIALNLEEQPPWLAAITKEAVAAESEQRGNPQWL